MKNLNQIILIFLLLFLFAACAQNKELETVVNDIYNNVKHSDKSFKVLEYLCLHTAGRLPGTSQSEKAIAFIQETLKKSGADSVWLVQVKAPGWKELKKPVAEILLNNNHRISLNSVTLGQSVSTPEQGIETQIVTIDSKEQIDLLGESKLKGKIVFFNGKMKVRGDYGKHSWQRVLGASMVSKYGAVGVLVRSLTTKKDNNPHTGVVHYDETNPKIPAVAISWQAADTLEMYLKRNPELNFHIETFCSNTGLVPSFNVVAEIKGSQFPDDIFLLTAHLDGWHNTQAAQDNGGGVAQVTDVIRIFKDLKIKPKRTIRVMAYMDEEQYLTGMNDYAENTAKNNQKHILDIEVDYGIGIPTGYNIQADSVVFTKQESWRKFLGANNLSKISFTGSYAEDWPLYQKDKTILAHLVCKDDQYFDYHHSANDVLESVNLNNLKSGSAALASFLYLLDKMDVIDNSKRVDDKH